MQERVEDYSGQIERMHAEQGANEEAIRELSSARAEVAMQLEEAHVRISDLTENLQSTAQKALDDVKESGKWRRLLSFFSLIAKLQNK